MWKSLVLSFHLLSRWLFWKIWNGAKDRTGLDPWIGCEGHLKLPEKQILHLRKHCIFTLLTYLIHSLWHQWWSANSLELEGVESTQYNCFTQRLLNSSIRLKPKYVLIWSKNPINGDCIAWLGYIAIFLDDEEEEVCWWWKPIWKLKPPMKTQICMWLAMSNKSLTWEVM